MIRVLGLALYGPMAASRRQRLDQYVKGLRMHGIDLHVQSLLDDEYLRRRFRGRGLPWSTMVQSAWRRVHGLLTERYDLAVVHCELLPLAPAWLESALLSRHRYIYDLDDAFYLKYREERYRRVEPFLGSKFDSIVRRASAVTAGSGALYTYARHLNDSVTLLPTVVDTDAYRPVARTKNVAFTIGWIGSPSTAPYLKEVVSPLSQLGSEGPVQLIVIGGNGPVIPNVDVIEVPWSQSTEVALINSLDVGIMPLPDTEWARAKCAFKLVQYMACAIPVVAAAVGENLEVVTRDCGRLCRTDADWVAALRYLRASPKAAARMGEAGRARVDQHYSLRRNLPIVADLIHSVTFR